MSAELLVVIAGAILSLLFEYVPGLNSRYNALADGYQKLIMLGMLLLAAGGVFALACLGRYDLVSCDVNGIWTLGEYFVMAAIANQTTHRLSP